MSRAGAKNFRKCLAIALISFAVTLGGLSWWSASQNPWHSHPDRVRDLADAWDQLLQDSVPSNPGPPLNPATVEHADDEAGLEGKGWWISHDRSSDRQLRSHPNGREIVWADESGIAQLPNGAGEVHLRAVALELSRSRPTIDYFDAIIGKPLDNAQLEALLPILSDRKLDFSGRNRPGLRWVLKLENTNVEIERMRTQPHVFDARTQVRLGESMHQSYFSDTTIVVDSWLNLWHDTDLILCCDLALGPAVEFEIPNEPNWQRAFDQFRIQYLAALPGRFDKYRSGLYVSKPELQSSPQETSALFAIEPPEFGNLIYDSATTNDEVTRFHLLNPVNHARLRVTQPMGVAADDIVSMRGRILPNLVTVAFRLSKIPGMPNPREKVDNLFNVVIPELTVTSEPELDKIITDSTQMRFDLFDLGFDSIPSEFFPHTFTNVTPRELLKVSEDFEGGYFISNPDEFTISIEYPETWSDRLKAWWKDLWN